MDLRRYTGSWKDLKPLTDPSTLCAVRAPQELSAAAQLDQARARFNWLKVTKWPRHS